jgi:hypothetical protein
MDNTGLGKGNGSTKDKREFKKENSGVGMEGNSETKMRLEG